MKVAMAYLDSDKTYQEVADELGIAPGLVASSVRFYRESLAVQARESGNTIQKGSKIAENAEEASLLREQVADLLLRLDAAETMIDLAEETFQIPIRKKCGSRQSND